MRLHNQEQLLGQPNPNSESQTKVPANSQTHRLAAANPQANLEV
jgi:hypothetical protein